MTLENAIWIFYRTLMAQWFTIDRIIKSGKYHISHPKYHQDILYKLNYLEDFYEKNMIAYNYLNSCPDISHVRITFPLK